MRESHSKKITLSVVNAKLKFNLCYIKLRIKWVVLKNLLARKVAKQKDRKKCWDFGHWENLNYKDLEHSENAKLLVLGGVASGSALIRDGTLFMIAQVPIENIKSQELKETS